MKSEESFQPSQSCKYCQVQVISQVRAEGEQEGSGAMGEAGDSQGSAGKSGSPPSGAPSAAPAIGYLCVWGLQELSPVPCAIVPLTGLSAARH